ncbi:uncharacterized protein LOC129601025 isoform X2 [Paramacrobiotus metropolitanus]|uniref:uncharacterized protein LOC129601025 isoform X2 n=1 Tax=Paramacrobiotus metropolitanus TaxID=2943436 RepID=UPI0024460502|nr:uncharacterized protein LOC129601025 isoform X2 [Paramacrobiotus metropolitanus]
MKQALRGTRTLHEHLEDHKFNPHDYIGTLLGRGDIRHRLQDSRHEAEHVKSIAVQGLKESAFSYHAQIVKAVKELKTMQNSLEELRGLLVEEQGVLSRAMEEPKALTDDNKQKLTETKRSRFITRKSLSGLFNKIDGFGATGLKDRERMLIGSKDVREVDMHTLEKRHNMIAHLFTDCIILTLWTPHHEKHVYIQYTFVDVIYFDFISAVEPYSAPAVKKPHRFFDFGHSNHKERTSHRVHFPFMVTFHNDPTARLFDVDSAHERDEWIAYLKEYASLLQNDKPRNRRLSTNLSVVHDSLEDILDRHRSSLQNMLPGEHGLAQWYRDAPVDINDYCDTKEYAQAIDLVREAQAYWHKEISWDERKEGRYYHRKCLDAEERLVEHLLENFRFALNCPLGVDWVTCGEIVGHLRELGLLFQAVLVYLDFRTWLLNQALEVELRDGTPDLYVQKKTVVVLRQFEIASTELKELELDRSRQHRTAFVAWIRYHWIRFCTDIQQFVFCHRLSFGDVQRNVQFLRQSAKDLGSKIGFDISLQLEGCLAESVARWLESWIERMGTHFKEETKGKCWSVVTFETDADQHVFIEQCKRQGLGDLSEFVDDHQLHIIAEVLHYAKEYLQLFDAIFAICHHGMRRLAKKCLALALSPLLENLRTLLSGELPAECNMTLIQGSVRYLNNIFIPNVEAVFHSKYVGCSYLLFVEKEALEDLLRKVNESLATQFYKRSHIAL